MGVYSIQLPNEIATYASIDLVVARLRKLHAELRQRVRPTIVDVDNGTGAIVSIGVGSPKGVCVLFRPAEASAPDVHARGSEDRRGSESFVYAGADTEVEEANLIDLEDALKAAEWVLLNGNLPTNVRWEPD
jgi:hypothetical protein